MSTAIWLLNYAVEDSDLADYLPWFHEVHVADKLARPGYSWAAHYRLVAPQIGDGTSPTVGNRYVGLFGGETPRVFLDPSPAQLKLRQDGLTREMMARRVDGRSTVYCEEWTSGSVTSGRAVAAPALRVEFFDAAGHDEDLAAWCAQEHMVHFAGSEGCHGGRKMIASAGSPRHCLLHEFDSVAGARAAAQSEPLSEWRTRVAATVLKPLGDAVLAERIWPLA